MTSTTAPNAEAMVTAAGRSGLQHRLADHGIDRMLLLLLPAAIFILVLFVYPFVYGAGLSLQPKGGGIGLGSYIGFFSDARQVASIWITLRIAIPAALFNVLASVPIALQLRGKFRGKRLLSTMLVIPISLGTVLIAQGLFGFVGNGGWINRGLLQLGWVTQPVQIVGTSWAVLLSLIITGFPFAYLLISSYLSGIDPSLEQAASIMGAGSRQRFTKIILPLLAPGLATTFMLTFILAFSVFPSAVMVGDPGNKTRVLSIAAWEYFANDFDYSSASAVAVIMGLIELIVLGVVMLWRSTLYRGSTGGKG